MQTAAVEECFFPQNTSVIGIERSGRYLAEGAVDFFECALLSAYPENTANADDCGYEINTAHSERKFIIPHLYSNHTNTVIFDSVIHTGGTIERVLDSVPSNRRGQIYIFCTEINESDLDKVEALSQRASFYCLRISCRKDKPTGGDDMGAKLFGTAS